MVILPLLFREGKDLSLIEIVQSDPFFKANVTELIEVKPNSSDNEFKALVDSIKDMSLDIIELSPNIPTESLYLIKNIESPSFVINFVSSNMNISLKEKQELLENTDLNDHQPRKALSLLTKELQMLEMKNEIQSKVKTDLDKQQREYYLHQQMKAIQEELGGSGSEKEIDEMRKRASEKKWNKEVEYRI